MAKSRWNKMTEKQKQHHRDMEKIRRKTLSDEQKQKQKEHHKRCRDKRRKTGKALQVEKEYQLTGKGYFFKWANTIKARAKKKNIPYDIDADFLQSIFTTHCPVLGVEFERGNGTPTPFSPTVDRIIPENGYVKDNIIIISKRANQIKSDASPEEIEMVFTYYNELIQKDNS